MMTRRALLLAALLCFPPAISAQTYAPLVTMRVTTPDGASHDLSARESSVATLTLKDGTVYEFRPTIVDEPFSKVTVSIFKAATATASTTSVGEVEAIKGRPAVESKSQPNFKVAIVNIEGKQEDTDLPARTANAQSSFQVQSDDDYWRIEVPLPGIDPKNVSIEVAGNTLAIRAGHPGVEARHDRQRHQYEQTFTVPPFLDIDRISAAHHHGMLQLTIPIKDSVKPRRIQIAGVGDERQTLEDRTTKDQQKQLTTA